jgi:hypothetical protein
MALQQYIYICNVIVLIQYVHLFLFRFMKENEDEKNKTLWEVKKRSAAAT